MASIAEQVSYSSAVMMPSKERPPVPPAVRLVTMIQGDTEPERIYHQTLEVFQTYHYSSRKPALFFEYLRQGWTQARLGDEQAQQIIRAATEKLIWLIGLTDTPNVQLLLVYASWFHTESLRHKQTGNANVIARACAKLSRNILVPAFASGKMTPSFKRAVCIAYIEDYADKIWDLDQGKLEFLNKIIADASDEAERHHQIELLRARLQGSWMHKIVIDSPAGQQIIECEANLVAALRELDLDGTNQWIKDNAPDSRVGTLD